MALKKQIKETKAAEVKAAAETKEEVKTAVKAAEDKVSEKVEEVKETAKKEAQPKEVKATVSGLYITGVRGIRGPLEKPVKKRGFFARLMGQK